MPTDIDQMRQNEIHRLERAIERRERALDALKKGTLPTPVPRRYTLEIPISIPEVDANGNADADQWQPVTRSVTIDRECRFFRVKEIVATTIVVGTIADVAQRFSLPAFVADDRLMFVYRWKARDTYTDREWSNGWLPSLLLASGKASGLQIAGPGSALPGGTELGFTIDPLYFNDGGEGFNTDDTTGLAVNISFVGHEVIG